MIQFYIKKLNPSIFENVSHIEVYLDGDHGKGSYLFIAILLFRYSNDKEIYRLEIKLGEINEEKDNIDYIEQLIRKILSSFTEMKINKEEDTFMLINTNNVVTYCNERTESSICFQLYIIGNTKG